MSSHLRLCFSLDEFSIFSPWGFRLPSLGLAHLFTLLSLTGCFEICSLIMVLFFYTIHLSWVRYIILCLIINLIFDSILIFYYEKVKDIFSHSHIFCDIRLDHLIISSLMELESKIELRMWL